MFVVLYENLLVLFNILCLNLLALKKEVRVAIKKREGFLFTFFIDLEGRVLCLCTREGSKPHSLG